MSKLLHPPACLAVPTAAVEPPPTPCGTSSFSDPLPLEIVQHTAPPPNCKSHSLFRSYRAILPTSLTHILLKTRDYTSWTPAAVYGTTGLETDTFPWIFMGDKKGRRNQK